MQFEILFAFGYKQQVSDFECQPIDGRTRFCAVYGHPIHHSASPAMQNAGIAELRLPWRYLAFDVHPERLAEAIAGAKAMKFIGLNLTVPHKLLALPMADVLDKSGIQYGAINTIRFEIRRSDSNWVPLGQTEPGDAQEIRSVGFNTDAEAVSRALREDLQFDPQGRSVLLLGAGGAGRVGALRLAEEKVGHLYLVNRTVSKAEQLRAEILSRFPNANITVGYPKEGVDLALNATSLGLRSEDPLPFDESLFRLDQAGAAYDMIYRPAQTHFLTIAKQSGCRIANGLGMLLYQGAKALEIWSGQSAPVAQMKQALVENVYGPSNFRSKPAI